MTFWDQLKKQFTAIIDLPIEAAQGAVRGHTYVSPSGALASTNNYTYSQAKSNQTIARAKSVKEAPVGRTVYSHGLEKIYSLETVDPKSIRVMDTAKDEAKIHARHVGQWDEPQSEFDFGPSFRTWITPCFLFEPLQILGLSSQTEKLLLNQKCKTVKDLVHLDIPGLVHVKGFGQGHIDELTGKLEKYIAGRNCRQSKQIEWSVWLRSIVAPLQLKEAKIFLESYGLGDVLTVPAHITMEIRRINAEEKRFLLERVIETLKSAISQEVLERWNQILQALVVPWMYLKGGVASAEELLERLECVSIESEYASKALQIISVLMKEESPFSLGLAQIEKDLFAVDEVKSGEVQKILALVRTYYYTPKNYYERGELTSWIIRELTKKWIDCSDEQVSKLLSYTSMLSSSRKGSQLYFQLK